MAKRTQPDFDVLDIPEDTPIILAGQPGTMMGELPISNLGSKRIVVREAQVRGGPLARTSKDAATRQKLGPITLHPGQGQRIPLNLALDPHCPPGQYEGEMEIAGHVRKVQMNVTETIALTISPSPIVIENQPGEKIAKQIVVTNRGNVPLTIGEIGAVLIEDEYTDCRTARAALAAAGDEIKSLDDYYGQLATEYKALFEETGFLRVHNVSGVIELQPGEVRWIELEIRVPDGLDKRTRYYGRTAVYTADINFIVVPAPKIHEPEDDTPKQEKGKN